MVSEAKFEGFEVEITKMAEDRSILVTGNFTTASQRDGEMDTDRAQQAFSALKKLLSDDFGEAALGEAVPPQDHKGDFNFRFTIDISDGVSLESQRTAIASLINGNRAVGTHGAAAARMLRGRQTT